MSSAWSVLRHIWIFQIGHHAVVAIVRFWPGAVVILWCFPKSSCFELHRGCHRCSLVLVAFLLWLLWRRIWISGFILGVILFFGFIFYIYIAPLPPGAAIFMLTFDTTVIGCQSIIRRTWSRIIASVRGARLCIFNTFESLRCRAIRFNWKHDAWERWKAW